MIFRSKLKPGQIKENRQDEQIFSSLHWSQSARPTQPVNIRPTAPPPGQVDRGLPGQQGGGDQLGPARHRQELVLPGTIVDSYFI